MSWVDEAQHDWDIIFSHTITTRLSKESWSGGTWGQTKGSVTSTFAFRRHCFFFYISFCHYLRLLISDASAFHPAALGCYGFWAWILITYLSHPLFHLLQTFQDGHPELGVCRIQGRQKNFFHLLKYNSNILGTTCSFLGVWCFVFCFTFPSNIFFCLWHTELRPSASQEKSRALCKLSFLNIKNTKPCVFSRYVQKTSACKTNAAECQQKNNYKSSLLFLSVTITQNETHGLWFTGRVDPAGHLLTCGSMSGLTYRDKEKSRLQPVTNFCNTGCGWFLNLLYLRKWKKSGSDSNKTIEKAS